MKTYENNMADQDVVVHSLRVLSDIKNPALSQLKRDLSIQQASAQALSLKQDNFYKSLSDDGIITPMEKKIIQREMENIANSYTALYTQAVAEQYDSAPFFQDYMATYAALRNYLYSVLHLFDNMDEDTAVDREVFNQYFANYYYSENYAIVSMTVGVITNMGFKILESLEDEGEEGEVGLYQGALYQYIESEWKIINRELYYGKSAVLPPAMEGRYFLNTANSLLNDVLYVNDELLEVNGEMLELGTDYEKGIIYVWENNHWQRKEPEVDYRYLVALGDYYSVKDKLPDIIKSEVETIARTVAGSNYYGALIVPPQNPQENDFFLYAGQTSGTLPPDREDWPDEPPPWIHAALYMYKNGSWKWLDETLPQNQKYYMEALQDILTITATSSGYFTTLFCNAFFANDAAMNSLSLRIIYLQQDGVIKSNNWVSGEDGLLIDAAGNIDANGNVHIGSGKDGSQKTCVIDGTTTITGNTTINGSTVRIEGAEIISTAFECLNEQPDARTVTYTSGTKLKEELSGGVGSYNNTQFDYGYYEKVTSQGYYMDIPKVVYDPNHYPPVYTKYEKVWVPPSETEKYKLYKDGRSVLEINNAILGYNMTYTYSIEAGSQTFKFKNLPKNKPVQSGLLYIDDGFLKIS